MVFAFSIILNSARIIRRMIYAIISNNRTN